MNSLITYWLSRTPGAAPEGPFTVGQLKAMYRTGAINAEAQLCPNGEQEWTESRFLLEEDSEDMGPASVATLPPLPQASVKDRMRRYDEEFSRREKKKGCNRGCLWSMGIIIALICLAGLLPKPGSEPAIPAPPPAPSPDMAAYYKTPEGQEARKKYEESVKKANAEAYQRQQAAANRASSAIQPSAWDGSVSEAKRFIERTVRDPSAIKYNQWKNFTNAARHITTVDFTATNGFGGPSRETWVFSFDRLSGKLMYVSSGGKTLYDAEP